MELTNNLMALYHTIKKHQPVTARELTKLSGYSSMTMQDFLTSLLERELVTREKHRERHYYIYSYSVVKADIPTAEFIYKNRLAAKRLNKVKTYPEGKTVIGNKTIHRCRDSKSDPNRGTGQRPGANHGGFSSSEMI